MNLKKLSHVKVQSDRFFFRTHPSFLTSTRIGSNNDPVLDCCRKQEPSSDLDVWHLPRRPIRFRMFEATLWDMYGPHPGSRTSVHGNKGQAIGDRKASLWRRLYTTGQDLSRNSMLYLTPIEMLSVEITVYLFSIKPVSCEYIVRTPLNDYGDANPPEIILNRGHGFDPFRRLLSGWCWTDLRRRSRGRLRRWHARPSKNHPARPSAQILRGAVPMSSDHGWKSAADPWAVHPTDGSWTRKTTIPVIDMNPTEYRVLQQHNTLTAMEIDSFICLHSSPYTFHLL